MGLTTDPNDPGIREIRSDGQQQVYLVLSDAQEAEAFLAEKRAREMEKHKGGGI